MTDLKHLHHWDVLAVSCIDGRFIKRTIDWVSEQTGGVFDFRTEVGSSKAIIDSLDDRNRLFDVIATSLKLHSIKEVWLIDHVDCGAYNGSKEHADAEAEKDFHRNKLEEAAKIVSEKFPELTVRKFYADWDEIRGL